jgi:metal-responsive CopG/Arc/MetJ family transcriptional regulator
MSSPRFSISLPDNLYKLLAKDAQRRGQSYAAVVRDAIARYYSDELDRLEEEQARTNGNEASKKQ